MILLVERDPILSEYLTNQNQDDDE
jgi:hypothetical protein